MNKLEVVKFYKILLVFEKPNLNLKINFSLECGKSQNKVEKSQKFIKKFGSSTESISKCYFTLS